MQCGGRWDLRTGVKRQHADMLMLWFTVSCGAGGVPDEQGSADAADVKGIRVEGAIAATAVGIGVGIDGAATVAAAAFDDGVGVGNTGAVNDAGIAV